jgi:hypothetical protein
MLVTRDRQWSQLDMPPHIIHGSHHVFDITISGWKFARVPIWEVEPTALLTTTVGFQIQTFTVHKFRRT